MSGGYWKTREGGAGFTSGGPRASSWRPQARRPWAPPNLPTTDHRLDVILAEDGASVNNPYTRDTESVKEATSTLMSRGQTAVISLNPLTGREEERDEWGTVDPIPGIRARRERDMSTTHTSLSTATSFS
ncbi:hypothetical protein Bbelb_420900 [Branchiostoma belcheri]|nr:hypothetical protein Bbelb_420900 [Branchiostoma belcheri]